MLILYFHSWPCLHQWLETRPNRQVCPVCKAGISKDKVIPLYGRGSDEKQDPRDKLPPRPQGQRTEPENNGVSSILLVHSLWRMAAVNKQWISVYPGSWLPQGTPFEFLLKFVSGRITDNQSSTLKKGSGCLLATTNRDKLILILSSGRSSLINYSIPDSNSPLIYWWGYCNLNKCIKVLVRFVRFIRFIDLMVLSWFYQMIISVTPCV